MIRYVDSLDGITPEQLQGFFVGWPNPPSPETHLRILKNSDAVVLAVDETGQVVGFITALTDGILYACITLLEVLPDYQAHGVGTELTQRMLKTFEDLYAVDLMCDEDVRSFYEKQGMVAGRGMMRRNFERQSGR